MLATQEDTALQVNVLATDPDNDPLTWTVLSGPQHGVLTGGTAGVFTYTPGANFTGSDSFLVRISDAGGRSTEQSVAIAVQSVNDVPVITPTTTSIVTAFGVSQTFVLRATDADGDQLDYAASSPAHGSVILFPDGTHTYRPEQGYFGQDSFTVTVRDGNGGTASQAFGVTVTAPIVVDPTFRFYAADGFKGGVGGNGTVFGSNGFQDITLIDRPGTIDFDASFNRGGDVIRLPGNAAAYSVSRTGASVTLADTDSTYIIPAGIAGATLVFADGARTLVIVDGAIRLGNQAIAIDPVAVMAAAEPGGVVSPFDASAAAKVFLQPDASIDVMGKVNLFGSTGNEQVTWHGGALTLDPSFNKGGDVLHMPAVTQGFSIYRAASSLVLFNADGSVTVPFGPVGMTVDFGGQQVQAVYDTNAGQLMIGNQAVLATSAATATPLSFTFA
jgi:VCBS repeat-containing protein